MTQLQNEKRKKDITFANVQEIACCLDVSLSKIGQMLEILTAQERVRFYLQIYRNMPNAAPAPSKD